MLALPLPYEASIAPTQTTPMLAQTCQPNRFFSKTVESAAVGSGTMLRSNWLIESEMKTSDQLLRPMFSACAGIQVRGVGDASMGKRARTQVTLRIWSVRREGTGECVTGGWSRQPPVRGAWKAYAPSRTVKTPCM
eukprot:scaffold46411_cov68-Phaeocystis_antarctica.AAC.2